MQLRALALTVVLTLAGLLAPPAAALGEDAVVHSVGRLVVDAGGLAAGDHLRARLHEADGRITGVLVPSVGGTVFSSVAVDDLRPSEKLSGVGSSHLLLKGERAFVRLHDDRRPSLHVDAITDATARWTLAAGARAVQDASQPGLVRVASAHGAMGALVATQGRIAVEGDTVVMRLPPGGSGAFLSSTGDLDQDEALFAAAAAQELGATIVAEVRGPALRASEAPFRRDVFTSSTAVPGGVESKVETASDALLAYDLSYEALPARGPGDVAAFVDGRPVAPRVFEGEGRAAVHVEVPAGSHRVQIFASGGAGSASQAQAEHRADARAYGDFRYHRSGKLEGSFLTAVVPDGRSIVLAYSSLEQGAQVFDAIHLDGDARAVFASSDGHRFQIRGPRADLTLVDDAYATHLVEARHRVDVAYRLADGVSATKPSDAVADLGASGALVLLGQGALHVERGEVRARLEEGARLLYRGAIASGFASEDVVRQGLADGRVGAQLLSGWQDAAVATTSTSYFEGVDALSLPGEALTIDYAPEGLAKSFVVDVRGSAVAARSDSDIAVTVDDIPAIPVSTAADALEDASVPRSFVEVASDGTLRIIVNTAAESGQRARVAIASRISDAARDATQTDSFGAFHLFDDGTAVGSFVTLRADTEIGAVSDFTLLATRQPVFASLAAGDSPFLASGTDGASVLRLENRDAKLEFSDTTAGFARVVAKRDTDLALRLASGLHAEERASGVVDITDAQGADVGSLVVTGASSFVVGEAGQLAAHLPQGAQALFRTHAGIEGELSQAQRSMVDQAIAAGRVAGLVLVQTQDAASAARWAGEAGEGVSIASASHAGEVTSTVTASYDSAVQITTAATRDRVELTVSSLMEEGRTILVSLDPKTVPGLAEGRARILYDGERIRQADSYADVLDATDDEGRAEAFVLAGDAGVQVLISIPHFSVHVVTLEEDVLDGDSPFFMYATGVLAALLVVETVFMALRRRKKSPSSTPSKEK